MPRFPFGYKLPLAWCAWLIVPLLTVGCASSDSAATMPPPDLHFDDAGLGTGSSCPSDRSLTYETFGRTFFATYCTRCHASDKVGVSARSGAPDGYDFDTAEGIRRMYRAIDNVAAAGPLKVNEVMPFNDPKPTEAERRRLGAWLACREGVELDAGAAR